MYGIARMKSIRPFVPSGAKPDTAAAQDEIGAMMQTGAAVASIRYASFARDTFWRSVTGRITLPTVRQLK